MYDDLFAMSNLRPRVTGVQDAVIWVCGGAIEGLDEPCIDVVPGIEVNLENLRTAIAVRMSEPPEILGHLSEPMATEVTRFITLNRRTLLLYWHGRIDSAEMIDQIVSVSQR